MSAAVSSAGFVSFGSMPYDDVYISSEEDQDEHVISDSRKPLMSPRKRPKITLRQPPATVKVHPLIKRRFLKWFYVMVTVVVISLVVFILLRISHDALHQDEGITDTQSSKNKHKPTTSPSGKPVDNVSGLPCTDFEVEDVWIQNIPKLLTETAFRLVDVNKDGVLDVIMGFSTGVTSYFGDQYIMCDIYFNNTVPCFGGLLALDGQTGQELWRHYAKSEIFAVNCNADVDQDGVKDCLSAGRAGAFNLVSGATGQEIWQFKNEDLLVSISNFYTAQFIDDVDGDGVQDVLNIHGGDPLRNPGEEITHIGLLLVISGVTGHVITSMQVPDRQESYYSPQVYFQHGGRQMVLFGTGGETHGGSLWVISMMDLLRADDSKATVIYTDPYKGIMTPPVLVDITGDGVVDIIMSMFNSTTVAFDGQSYKQIWNYTTTGSESYSTPAAAYFNDDDIPDFMITYNYGPGYPLYYHSQVTILDGRTGQPILDPPIQTAGSSQSSPLTISIEGQGRDFFMFFIMDCLGHEGESNKFSFLKDNTGTAFKSRSDFCKQRFNTKSFSRLMLLNQHMKPPGHQIYNSLDRVDVEYQYKINSSLLAQLYLDKHPSVLKEAKELALNGHHSHDGDANGEVHSVDRGDQDTNGYVHSDSRGSTDGDTHSNDPLPGFQDEDDKFSDDISNQEQYEVLKDLAEKLGYDDISELVQRLVGYTPVANQQDLDRDDDPLDRDDDSLDRDDDSLDRDDDPLDRDDDPLDRDDDPLDRDDDPLDRDDDPLDRDDDSLKPYPHQQNLQDPDPQKPIAKRPDPLSSYPHNSYPHNSYPHNSYPHNSYPHNSYPHNTDPQNSDPQNSGPQNFDPQQPYLADPYQPPAHPQALDSLNTDTGDEDESVDGISTHLLQDVLNQLLNDEQEADPVDQQPDGDETHRYDNPQSNPRYKSQDRNDPVWPDTERNKSYLDELLDRLGDTTTEKQYDSRYYDSKPGYRQGGEQYDRYGDAKRDRVEDQRDRWLNNLYGSTGKDLDDPVTRRRFIQKRDTLTNEQTNQNEAVKLSEKATNQRQRFTRHSGPHDAGGIQRLISTGTLAPVLTGQGALAGESIDLIFATYWFYPSSTRIILPEQQDCIDKLMENEAQRLDPKNVFYGLDHDAYEHMASDECLEKGANKEKLRAQLSSLNPLDIYPFNRHTGEMTVYRLRLTCRCGIKPSAHKRCAKVQPYSKQQWGSYMGTFGNSHFSPR